ncbi:MAG TPA: DUF1707 domain-containing protein [Pseudonocardiaceae bacterium]|jgi:hypothetical protein|nr:DUF1707 domain-containing protein [Pseudonocardiaceae bacterium]
MFGERSTRRRSADDHLRASDAEREYVIDLLQRAVGQGMLDLDEFSARADVALAARTRTDLNRVLLDLPDLVPDQPLRTDDVLVLRSTLSEVQRRGQWLVPGRLLIISRLGSTKLDFTEAEFTQSRVLVELAVTGGSVDLLVPPTATVHAGAVTTIGGQVVDRRPPLSDLGEPTFVLTGKVRAGEVRIRRPRLGPALLRVSVALGIRAAEQLARRLPAG